MKKTLITTLLLGTMAFALDVQGVVDSVDKAKANESVDKEKAKESVDKEKLIKSLY